MKRIFIYSVLLHVCLISYSQQSNSIQQFNIGNNKEYSAKAEFIVTQPITQEDVKYTVKIFTAPSVNDKLLPIKYLIESSDTTDKKSIYSYFDGNYFNYSGGKFREYHWEQDSLPFRSTSQNRRNLTGVHKSGLFAILVPSLLNEQINLLANNQENRLHYSQDTIVFGKKSDVLYISEYIDYNLYREMKLTFDAETNNPNHYLIISNPGSVGEQTIEVLFSPLDEFININEACLIKRYENIFSENRTSNFSANALIGKKLPLFNLPSLSGERYIWNGSSYHPSLVAFLNSNESMSTETVKMISNALNDLPFQVLSLSLYTDKDTEHIKHIMGNTADDYTVLFNAQRLATQCGITNEPTILIVDKNGIIRNAIIGFSNNLKDEITQFILHTFLDKQEL